MTPEVWQLAEEVAGSPELLRQMLAEKGIRATQQRISVLEALTASEVPLTAEQLFVSLHDNGGDLSLSTVYRILDNFCEHGLVSRSGLMDGGKAMFEMVAGVHRHNLICIKCHRIFPLADCPLKEYEASIAASTGFRISGHKLEVYGVCPKCR